jgi:hypothetical protein
MKMDECNKTLIKDYINTLINENKVMKEFIRDIYKNWDCDQDAHKYNTPCRACEAEKILKWL